MVSVGDSTDVYLFEVLDGGREFRKIKQYSAATDSGFSTAWSRDGRKFAVASQGEWSPDDIFHRYKPTEVHYLY